jgi:SAM-dependent methyltransferase
MLSATVHTLPPTTDTMRAFAEWAAKSCTSESLALDVGAGYDLNQVDGLLQPLVRRLVGIDPSENIQANRSLHEGHQTTLEDFAIVERRRFDLIIAAWVLEHVGDPPAFLQSCRSLLKPGGKLLAITPNLHHYFGLATKTAAALGLEDRILDRLLGPSSKAEYHFPTVYRVNTIHSIGRLLDCSGFVSVEFRCCDRPKDYDYVVPQALRWFSSLYSHLVYRLRLPALMGSLMFQATAACHSPGAGLTVDAG